MPLVIISIPLMILAVAAAAIPLLIMSRRDHQGRLESGEQREHALALIEARRNMNTNVHVSDVTPAGSVPDNGEVPLAA
jgi:flagellar basal body-associated protein FliL